jgi:hypothetical protein
MLPPVSACRPESFVRSDAVIRLRPLSEAECYARCYGSWEPTVRVIRLERRPARYPTGVTGEQLRRSFEERIDARIAEAAAEAA